MPNPQPRQSFRPRVEALESRETPSVSPLAANNTVYRETFDNTPVGALPTGWSQWSTGGRFGASTLHAVSGKHGLTANDGADQQARAWINAVLPADVQASADVYIDNLIPAVVFVRGSNLGSNNPTCYAVDVRRGLYAQLVRVVNGQATVLADISSPDWVNGEWINVSLTVSGDKLQAQIYRPRTGQYLNSSGHWQSGPTPALKATDSAIAGNGRAGLGRMRGYAGPLTFDNFTVNANTHGSTNPGTTGGIARHYDWIRLAELAYSGLPIGGFEDTLLRNSVDLVVSDVENLMGHIHVVAPNTPQVAYLNTSSLYLNLLTDWLSYADAHGIAREDAFYHVSQPTPFTGNSPSSQPVDWFWGVYLAGGTPDFIDETNAAHDHSQRITFGNEGQSLYVGYPEKFREINFNLAAGAANGWSAVLEYPTAVDSLGNPTAWAPLHPLKESTGALTHSGQVVFDPPDNWKPAVAGGSAPLYYLRIRTINDGRAPQAYQILGRDYVNARGNSHGMIPAFDYAADKDHDGYLNDAEYAHRTPGMDARFAYESRVFYGYYGQERFATNPSNPSFRQWAVDYSLRYLASHPYANGLFMDNSGGNAFLSSNAVLEPTSFYSRDYGALLSAIGKAIAPRWILANTSGGSTTADGVVAQSTGYFEEFALRPLSHNYSQFEDLAALVAHRTWLRSPSPFAVLDALPAGGSPTDGRTQLATLAEYYLLADPQRTFLDPFGGFEPGTSWTRHWLPAATYDVGQPRESWSVFATGSDPANRALTYRVYQRSYSNALVLYKPLSYASSARSPGGLSGATATTHNLGGTYRPLRADGTLGAPLTRVTLRNGEGAILIKA
jgi:hypothetical protein